MTPTRVRRTAVYRCDRCGAPTPDWDEAVSEWPVCVECWDHEWSDEAVNADNQRYLRLSRKDAP